MHYTDDQCYMELWAVAGYRDGDICFLGWWVRAFLPRSVLSVNRFILAILGHLCSGSTSRNATCMMRMSRCAGLLVPCKYRAKTLARTA
jgi:hypothetical protein